MVETEVLLKCIVFIVILDYTKNFSLACQYKDIDIILLVERNRWHEAVISQLFVNKLQASPESVFELPHVINSDLT